jgi:hypothetical protein
LKHYEPTYTPLILIKDFPVVPRAWQEMPWCGRSQHNKQTNKPNSALKETKNPARYYYNSRTNLKFQHKAKISSFKNPHIRKIDLLLLPRGPKSLKLPRWKVPNKRPHDEPAPTMGRGTCTYLSEALLLRAILRFIHNWVIRKHPVDGAMVGAGWLWPPLSCVSWRTRTQWKKVFCSCTIHPSIHPSTIYGGPFVVAGPLWWSQFGQ